MMATRRAFRAESLLQQPRADGDSGPGTDVQYRALMAEISAIKAMIRPAEEVGNQVLRGDRRVQQMGLREGTPRASGL